VLFADCDERVDLLRSAITLPAVVVRRPYPLSVHDELPQDFGQLAFLDQRAVDSDLGHLSVDPDHHPRVRVAVEQPAEDFEPVRDARRPGYQQLDGLIVLRLAQFAP
jgi:hypothetical protein